MFYMTAMQIALADDDQLSAIEIKQLGRWTAIGTISGKGLQINGIVYKENDLIEARPA